MAYTTIDDGSAYFTTTLYTGNASTNAITNSANAGDFQPDWVWLKSRNSATHHRLYDSSRGVLKNLLSSANNSEATTANSLTSFDSNGFTLGSDDNSNQNSKTFVGWQWKANGGTATASGSESGNNPAYSYQANTTAGFSIVTYTGTGSAGTVSHGLGVAPDWILVKNRTDSGADWCVYHSSNTSAPETDFLKLNTTEATEDVNSIWNDTAPTSSVFTVGTSNGTNGDGDNYVAYCFAEIKGYSKFGSYTGNANADGPFVYTGFKPVWLLTRRINTSGSWTLFNSTLDDNTSGKHGNPNTQFVHPNLSNAEATTGANFIDFLSNGFKLKGTDTGTNGNGDNYIYMTFAEHPFVSSKGVPTTAR
jgi:hypothetical protein